MATAPVSRKLNLTRDQLAAFLTDQQQIRQFELLFAIVDAIAPDVVNEINIAAGSAQATANEALAQITRMANAVELLAASPVIENNNSTVTDYLDFNGVAPHVTRIRRMAWNDSDKTVDIGMDYGVIQQVGQEVYARVRNNTGVTIPNGSVVYFTGTVPDTALSVAPYIADGSIPSLYVVGVMTHDLPDTGEKGYATVFGFVRGIDTSGFAVTDVLYASPTVVGGYTNVKPTAPDNVIPIGIVTTVDAADGIIFVRPVLDQQLYYGEFTKLDSQTPAAINTAYALTFTNTEIASGISIGGTTSQIIVSQAGLYNLTCSVQITSTSSSQKAIWVWFRKNGTTDLPNSARLASITLNNGYLVVSLNEVSSLVAGDFIEVMYAADSTNVSISTVAATAFAPAAPAAILAVTQTQQ